VRDRFDAVVVGSGPNGLGAAAVLARAGRSVLVLEAQDQIGGGTRTVACTLPGFRHDHCSAVHPLGAASPLFRDLPLDEHGLEWVHPDVAMAHPLDDGSAAAVYRSVEETADGLGVDGKAWTKLVGRTAARWDVFGDVWLSPMLRLPRHPLVLARFGPNAMLPVTTLARARFKGEQAKAALAGFAAHSILPLGHPLTGAVGVVFNAAAHAVGMPVARGGSQSIADALASYVRANGGEIVTGQPVTSMADLPPADAVLFDLTPRQILAIAGDRLSARAKRGFRRYKYGNGSFKVDYALDGPMPWKADACRQAGTIHVGGTIAEVAAGEADVAAGRHPERPFVLAATPTVCDPTRAPAGKHVLWAYCHVPAGSTFDMTERIEAQLERFAPGFRDRVLARNVDFPADLERSNANIIGGDIAGGYTGGRQMFFRPRVSRDPWTIGDGVYICSQSTPPGVGVHGMCGYYAAQSALKHLPRQ
jgi:phytoene dehydrogenase-like protein